LKKKAFISFLTQYDEKSIAQAMFGQDTVIKRDRGYISKEILAKCPTVKLIG